LPNNSRNKNPIEKSENSITKLLFENSKLRHMKIPCGLFKEKIDGNTL